MFRFPFEVEKDHLSFKKKNASESPYSALNTVAKLVPYDYLIDLIILGKPCANPPTIYLPELPEHKWLTS